APRRRLGSRDGAAGAAGCGRDPRADGHLLRSGREHPRREHPGDRRLMIRAWLGGVALALSWLTMLPARGPSEIDRAVAGRAISAAPVAGAVLAAAATAVCLIGSTVGTPPLVTGLVCVGVLAVGTRGMHVDGLSDTADGLGC